METVNNPQTKNESKKAALQPIPLHVVIIR